MFEGMAVSMLEEEEQEEQGEQGEQGESVSGVGPRDKVVIIRKENKWEYLFVVRGTKYKQLGV